jgi:hypothetical protein
MGVCGSLWRSVCLLADNQKIADEYVVGRRITFSTVVSCSMSPSKSIEVAIATGPALDDFGQDMDDPVVLQSHLLLFEITASARDISSASCYACEEEAVIEVRIQIAAHR